MYLCIYVCIYVSMYLCIYVSMYLCIYAFMYLRIYVSMYQCINCIYASMYLCIYALIYQCINVSMHQYIYVCVRKYIPGSFYTLHILLNSSSRIRSVNVLKAEMYRYLVYASMYHVSMHQSMCPCMFTQIYSFYSVHTQFKFNNRVGKCFEGRFVSMCLPGMYNCIYVCVRKYIVFTPCILNSSSRIG